MLPYGIVRYHGATADLRDIPFGTVLRVHAFLPPDPKISSVPVLPVNSKNVDTGHYRGIGSTPAENHVLLLEDEPSSCQREGKVWKLKEVEVKNVQGMIVASLEPNQGGDGKAADETMNFDAATRIWRGRESLSIAELIAEGAWPAEGKIPRWRERPARYHLEAHTGWRVHPVPHLGHLAGRRLDRTRRPQSDRSAQGLHS
jgi:hypothetical protein